MLRNNFSVMPTPEVFEYFIKIIGTAMHGFTLNRVGKVGDFGLNYERT